MLKDYPILFNDVEIPWMRTWEEQYSTVEQVYQTEAGTDQIDVSRYGKLTVRCGTACLLDTLKKIKPFSELDSFTLKRWEPLKGEYEGRTVRMRQFQYALRAKSWDLTEADGIWEVSFELEEF